MMRERLHLRPGRDPRPSRHYAPAPSSNGWAHRPQDDSTLRGPEDFSSFSSPGEGGRLPPPERGDPSDQQGGYANRIMALARETVRRLFRHEGEAEYAEAGDKGNRDDGGARRRELPDVALTPPNKPFAPPPVPHDGATQRDYYEGRGDPRRYPSDTAQAQSHPSTAHFDANQDASGPFAHAKPYPTSVLGRGADSTITSTAPNVTVYQFFNTPAYPEQQDVAAPPLWYGRHSYGFAAPPPARAVADVRPTIQYKRQRAQQEEVRQLQAPPLQRRNLGATTTSASTAPTPPPPPPVPRQEPQETKPAKAPEKVPSPRADSGAEGGPKSGDAPKTLFGSPAPPPASTAAPTTTDKVKSPAPPPSAGNPFLTQGSAAVVAEKDSGPTRSDGEEVPKKDTPAKADSNEKPSFFGSAGLKFTPAAPVPPSAAPPQPKGTMPSPFSFGGGGTTATTTATTTTSTATPFGLGSSNPFLKQGPPAAVPNPDDSAPGNAKKNGDGTDEPTKEAPVAKPTFSFTASNSFAPLGASTATPGASTSAAATTAVPPASSTAPNTAPSTAPAPVNTGFGSFRKPGPPAVIPEDDGFATDEDDSDDDSANAKRSKKEEAQPPAKAVFSFNLGGGGNGASGGGAPPANPFSFGGGGGNATSGGAPPANPFSFGGGTPGSSMFGKSGSTSDSAPKFSFFQKN